ncbi:MAG: YggS family pyridoxal phosphate-dependent enzyme [Spirochaetota bacterium]
MPDGYVDEVASRLSGIRARVAAAAEGAGRASSEVDIMAVSKFHPLAAVEAAYRAGIRIFGENRLQEAETKFADSPLFRSGIQLDMLGHLQTNKINKALRLFSRIQSIDSCSLLEDLIRRAKSRDAGREGPLEILFELHTAEDSKSGFMSPGEIHDACRIMAQEGKDLALTLIPRGLMTMGPLTEDESAIRDAFGKTRRLFDEIRKIYLFPDFSVLSMGMSKDFEIAVEEGSTLVRIGTALFGERKG